MPDTNQERFEFDKFRVEVAERILWRAGERVRLPDKAFDTLCLLISRGNQLVSKEDFFSVVWTNSIVEENNLDKNISILRKILGEPDGHGKFIETVHGHGYRFVAEVNAVEPDLRIKTIAVLPFKPLTAENRNEALELGMADTLISKLSGNEEFITRPLSAVRRYSSVEQDSLAAGRELGTEAVLDGGIQIWGDRVRISARFFRTGDGKQLWSGQFEEKLADIFAVQDSIAERVAAALKEINPKSADTHLAYGHLLSNTGRHAEALAEFKYSRELNPLSLLANACEGQALFFAGRLDRAADLLNKTIDLEPNYPITYLFISRVYSEKGMHAEAIKAALKAREISRGNAEALALTGYELAKSGEKEKALEVLEELRNLSNERYVPSYNFALVDNGLGNREKALDHLEIGFTDKNALMVFLKVEPKWNNLRGEPRFIALMKRMNFE